MRITAHDHAVHVGHEVEIAAVENCADTPAAADEWPNIVRAPAIWVGEIAFRVVLHDHAVVEGDKVDIAAVKGRAVKTRGVWGHAFHVEDFPTRGVFELASSIQADDAPAVFVFCLQRDARSSFVSGTEVDIVAVKAAPWYE